MEWPLKIQGRMVHESDVDVIRTLLGTHTDWHRSRLSVELCRRWNWRRSDGQLKDMACREFLLKLERRGLIVLPPRRTVPPGPVRPFPRVDVDETPLEADLESISPIVVIDVRECKEDERAFNYLLSTHHYLGFGRTVGRNMKYFVRGAGDRPLACVLFGAAAWKAEDRDRFIGWSAATRERNLNLLTNNTRFLILPWIHVKCLASHVLGKVMRRLSSDWVRRYGADLALVETFVDTSRYAGTCYKAANFLRVGQTKGRTRQDRYTTMNVPVKDIYIYALRPDFRRELCRRND